MPIRHETLAPVIDAPARPSSGCAETIRP
jgi:hypothetical protein